MSDQDSDNIKELRNASNLNEREIKNLLKSSFEANLSEAEVCSKKIKGLSRSTIFRVFKNSGKLAQWEEIWLVRKNKIQVDIF